MSLSDKIGVDLGLGVLVTGIIKTEDIKEFIKKLKEKLKHEVIFQDDLDQERCFELIDQEAGDKLI